MQHSTFLVPYLAFYLIAGIHLRSLQPLKQRCMPKLYMRKILRNSYFQKKNHEATQQSCEREKAKLLVCFGVDGQHLIDAYLHIIQHPTDKSLIIQQNK